MALPQTTLFANSIFIRSSFERIWHFANSFEQDLDMSYPESLLENLRFGYISTKERVKSSALNEAKQVIESSHNRCAQLKKMNEEQLALQYLTLATTAYDKSCGLYQFTPNATQRGRHIHKIAEHLALTDRKQSAQCANYRYPFDGIEQCYLWGLKAGRSSFCLPCSVKPDLYNSLTGSALDYKTGNNRTDIQRHFRTITHVPEPASGYVTTKDVTMQGVEYKYSSRSRKLRA